MNVITLKKKLCAWDQDKVIFISEGFYPDCCITIYQENSINFLIKFRHLTTIKDFNEHVFRLLPKFDNFIVKFDDYEIDDLIACGDKVKIELKIGK